MEALLIRIDMLRDRRQYVAVLKEWFAELAITHGRLVTMGDVHLLFIAAETAQITKLLEFYATRMIDTNSRGELCVDKFIDVIGRKNIDTAGCKGFLEMNILNKSMLEKMVVHEWHGESEWIESALATPRTRALLAWREETKALRKDRRQKSAKERQVTKEQKKQQQAEAEAAAKAAKALEDAAAAASPDGSSDDSGDDNGESRQQQLQQQESSDVRAAVNAQEADDSDDGSTAVTPTVETAPIVRQQHPKAGGNKHKRPAGSKGSPGRYTTTSGQWSLQNHHGQSHHSHAYSHSQQQPLAPSTAASEAGRMKTEQVVLEFLYKAAELVIQSRVNFQSEAGHRRGNRRARFNLDIEEVQFVREAMTAWRENVHLPLAISIYLDSDSDRRVLLEQWSVVYALDGAAAAESDPHSARRTGSNVAPAAPRDVIQQLKEVCKKISVLLRSLYSFMRLLPAHRLVKRSLASHLSYELHATSATVLDRSFERDAPTSRYSFVPIATPFGFLKVMTLYRLNCERIREEEEAAQPAIFKENFIIQDYVPSSPELLSQRGDGGGDDGNGRVLVQSPARARAATAFSPEQLPEVPATLQYGNDQRRRSSPPQIAADDNAARRTQSLSRPMAIPQAKTPASAFDESVASPRESGKMLHAHSYGDPDRLRAVAANPNVAAAPYGYGNVAIEREDTPPSHWTGMMSSGGSQGTGTGNGGAMGAGAGAAGISAGTTAASYQDESSHYPLSTPPRHPNSLLSLKHSRTFSSLTGSRKGAGDGTHFRSSLENFSLDDGTSPSSGGYSPAARSPSPHRDAKSCSSGDRAATFLYSSRRHESFSGAFASDESGGSSVTMERDGVAGNSPRSTPPFMYAESPTQESPGSTAALVLRRTSFATEPGRGVPVFASSPPFQANPTELLSTSPGYSYSKNYLRKGPSSLPMFVTTDQFQLGRTGALRLNAGGGGGGVLRDARGFSSDLYDAGAGVWGVSPDSPDAFGLALTGGSSSSNGQRHRFLSSSDSTGGAEGESGGGAASQFDPYDMSDLMLPFAIGDDVGHSTATTATSTLGSESGRASGAESAGDARKSGGGVWDTASVGSFLNQLKHAPRLQMFQDSALSSEQPLPSQQQQHDDGEHEPRANGSRTTATPVPSALLFDDELASFRTLRDELARDL